MKKIKWNFLTIIALGLGSGLSPKAPGTVGSLVSIIPWIFVNKLEKHFYSVFLLIAIAIGWLACDYAEKMLQEKDPSCVVWDEFLGMWVALSVIPTINWQHPYVEITLVVLGFLIFRILDILKPGPIKYLEKNFKGGSGIILDDLLAGIITAVLLAILQRFL